MRIGSTSPLTRPHPGIEPGPQAPAAEADFTDVSHYDGKVDWDTYAGAGKALAACKVTEGSDWSDNTAAQNREALDHLHLPCGLYHFAGRSGSHKIGKASQEADFYLQQVGTLKNKEFPVLDFELSYGLTPAEQSAWIGKWCSAVEDKTGRTPWLYTNASMCGKLEGLTKYPLWVADYRSSDREHPPACAPWNQLTAWQYSESARIPGVAGPADGNYLYHNPLP